MSARDVPESDPTRRFSNRVADYVRFRPSYPAELIERLVTAGALGPETVVADVGCGTGKLAELFLRNGNSVVGVEPNAEMRQAGSSELAAYSRYHGVDGRAEATGLEAHSVDLVAAGQAFHWFDPSGARAEFQRILRPPCWVVLVWNDRRIEAGPFMRGYESLLERHASDYGLVGYRHGDATAIRRLFAPARPTHGSLRHYQEFDRAGLEGRLLSASYAPAPGRPGHREMLDDLAELFRVHQREGRVRFEYETRYYVGRLCGEEGGG